MDRDWNERVWDLVALIPRGKVATYGQLAVMLGHPRRARQVGYALHRTPEDRDLPWHRVINARGCISFPEHSEHFFLQRALLAEEDVVFHKGGRIDLKRFGWQPA